VHIAQEEAFNKAAEKRAARKAAGIAGAKKVSFAEVNQEKFYMGHSAPISVYFELEEPVWMLPPGEATPAFERLIRKVEKKVEKVKKEVKKTVKKMKKECKKHLKK